MDFLLDTHTIIWFLNGDKQLSKTVLSLIENTDNKKFVSICSLQEISIKLGLRKLEFDGAISAIVDLIEENGFDIIPISVGHVVEYGELAFVHRDPFDRMLVAQAMVVDLIILTRDENIPLYKVKTRW